MSDLIAPLLAVTAPPAIAHEIEPNMTILAVSPEKVAAHGHDYAAGCSL